MQFGRLTALYLAPRDTWHDAGRADWVCECDCGKWVQVRGRSLRMGCAVTCGCRNPNFRHGYGHTPEYKAWFHARERCNDPTDRSYHNYGGRGIRMCPEWDDVEGGFERFYAHIGPRPEWATGGLDRIDNDGHYEPGNVRWATMQEQRHNQRSQEAIMAANLEALRREAERLQAQGKDLRKEALGAVKDTARKKATARIGGPITTGQMQSKMNDWYTAVRLAHLLGITNREIAEAAGVSEVRISQIISGRLARDGRV